MEWFHSPLNLSYFKMALLAAALSLWLLRYVFKSLSNGWGRKIVIVLLAALTLLSIASYFHFGKAVRGYLANYHDVYHYYLGSKYSQELGYSNLYLCSLIADSEMNDLTRAKNISVIRNLDSYGYVKVAKALSHPEKCKDRFGLQRWEEFKKDLLFFQSHEKAGWKNKIQDKGYNATPIWNMIAAIISNSTPIDEHTINLLAAIDIVLILFAFILAAYAFGPETALLMAVVFFASYQLHPTHIRGGFMRYDWIATLLTSVSLLKMKKYSLSGVALAFSTASRVFPMLFAAGLGFKLLLALLRKREESRRYLAFFVAFAVTLAALTTISLAYYGSTDYWREFNSKIELHNNDISTTRIGLKYFFINRGETSNLDFEKTYGDYNWTTITRFKQLLWNKTKPFCMAVSFLICFMWLFLQRRLKDHESLAFGFPLIFLFTAPTFYYYIAFAVFPMAFADGRERRFLYSSAIMTVSWISLFIINNAVEYWWSKYLYMGIALFSASILVMLLFAVNDPAIRGIMGKALELLKASTRMKQMFKSKFAMISVLLFLVVLFGVAIAKGPVPSEEILDRMPQATDDGSRAMLVVGGDLNLGRNVERIYKQRGAEYLAEGLLPEIKGADILFANLECVLTLNDQKRPKKGNPTFHIKADPQMASLLTDLGVDVVSLANNHSMDYGCEGLSEEIRTLSNTKVLFGGAGMDINSASKANMVEVNGIRVGFLHYTTLSTEVRARKGECGINHISLSLKERKKTYERLRREIRNLRREADVVFVSIHWGVNYTTEVREYMVDFARKVIKFGAHGVIGHHAHQFLAMDSYAGRPILYDTGNFLFDSMDKTWMNRQGMFKIELSKQGVKSVEFVPYYFKHPERRAIAASRATRRQTIIQMQNMTSKIGGKTKLRDDRLFLVLD